ncbi:histone H1-like [Symphorus nematophorus]
MAEEAPAAGTAVPPAAPPAKAPKRKSTKPLVKRSGPTVRELIVQVVGASKEKKGISYPGLKRALAAKSYDTEKNRSLIKRTVKNLVEKKVLLQNKGAGASGWFKLNKAAVEKPKKVAKKPAAKTAVKKTKSVKKAKSTKTTPKKAKKPAAVKKSAGAKKKAAAKKSPKKKPAPKKASKKTTPKKAAPKKAAKSVKAKKGPSKKAAKK